MHKVALMLSDIRMPGTSGVDLVPQALEIEPDLAILMLTAVNDATSAALHAQRRAGHAARGDGLPHQADRARRSGARRAAGPEAARDAAREPAPQSMAQRRSDDPHRGV